MGTEELWPCLLAVSGVPAVLQFVTLQFFPEAPRYLYIDKGDTEGAKQGDYKSHLDFLLHLFVIGGDKNQDHFDYLFFVATRV